jgi:uncharacterized protein
VDNLRETRAYRGGPLGETGYDEIARLALRYIDGREPLLAERAASGCSVDGHGDLIADDVFCLPDYPRVLDCLEFDDQLRWLDVLDDVAFLAMDIEHLGHPELAQRFLGWYHEFSGTPAVWSLQHHYVAYRAFVRAKVACIRHGQGQPEAAADAEGYARLALQHLRAGEVTLLLVGGAPGTGKTTLARHIADHYGWVLLSTDAVRRQIPPSPGGYYTPAAKAAAYRQMLTHASHALQHGESVIADATWSQVAMRELASGVAAATASRLIALECCAPVDIAAARAQERLTSGQDRSEAGAAIARYLFARRDSWPAATKIHTDTSPGKALQEALVAVASAT